MGLSKRRTQSQATPTLPDHDTESIPVGIAEIYRSPLLYNSTLRSSLKDLGQIIAEQNRLTSILSCPFYGSFTRKSRRSFIITSQRGDRNIFWKPVGFTSSFRSFTYHFFRIFCDVGSPPISNLSGGRPVGT